MLVENTHWFSKQIKSLSLTFTPSLDQFKSSIGNRVRWELDEFKLSIVKVPPGLPGLPFGKALYLQLPSWGWCGWWGRGGRFIQSRANEVMTEKNESDHQPLTPLLLRTRTDFYGPTVTVGHRPQVAPLFSLKAC